VKKVSDGLYGSVDFELMWKNEFGLEMVMVVIMSQK
jgi:hypothetical protein